MTIFISTEPTDMRKAFDGLSAIVERSERLNCIPAKAIVDVTEVVIRGPLACLPVAGLARFAPVSSAR